MRSTFKTIAFATIALSLATGGAFAASGHEKHEGGTVTMGGHDSEPLAQPTPVVIAQTPVYKPRLSRVLAGLQSADARIDREQAMHKLSARTAYKLDGEANGIRNHAMNVAKMHNGAIPSATFQRLKGDIRKLDRDIVRLS